MRELIERLKLDEATDSAKWVGRKAREVEAAIESFTGVVQQVEYEGAKLDSKLKNIVKDLIRMADQMQMISHAANKYVK